MWYPPSVDYIIELHKTIMQIYGGKAEPSNDRLRNCLEAALDILVHGHPVLDLSFCEKICKFLYELSNRQCFLHGNKRLTNVLLDAVLDRNGYGIAATQDEVKYFIISFSDNSLKYDEALEYMMDWLSNHVIRE